MAVNSYSKNENVFNYAKIIAVIQTFRPQGLHECFILSNRLHDTTHDDMDLTSIKTY